VNFVPKRTDFTARQGEALLSYGSLGTARMAAGVTGPLGRGRAAYRADIKYYHERDDGILSFVAAQPVSPRWWWSCPGRLNFTGYDRIPRFAMDEVPRRSRIAGAMGTAIWVMLLASVITIRGLGRARWAIGS
jgi:hypothetical protein